MNELDALPYAQYADLLDLHGRSAVSAFGALHPRAVVPPHGSTAEAVAIEHLGTLQVWAWMLANPGSDWRERDEVAAPGTYDDVVGAVARELDRLEDLLQEVGPARSIDYFDREGTTHEVARLLAHEAISVATATSRASGRQAPPLHPDVATDCVDRTLSHWSEPEADVDWHTLPAHLTASDTGRSWWVSFGGAADEVVAAIGPAAEAEAAVTVTAPSAELLAWLEGYPDPTPAVGGDARAYRLLRAALGHELEPLPRRRWWRRG